MIYTSYSIHRVKSLFKSPVLLLKKSLSEMSFKPSAVLLAARPTAVPHSNSRREKHLLPPKIEALRIYREFLRAGSKAVMGAPRQRKQIWQRIRLQFQKYEIETNAAKRIHLDTQSNNYSFNNKINMSKYIYTYIYIYIHTYTCSYLYCLY
ncbi:hypothetical protein BDF14DRAFT_736573 [Spinellus fusiger]|nr:hypothetical protein BDF14DRAFT_736573 [Spinellus fusiger]